MIKSKEKQIREAIKKILPDDECDAADVVDLVKIVVEMVTYYNKLIKRLKKGEITIAPTK